MLSLVYASSATEPMSEAALDRLLASSRSNNAERHITGMLLYKDGQFLQVLEGDDETVRDAYAEIARDARHEDVRVLLDSPIDRRQFEDWTMAYRRVSAEDLSSVPGYDPILHDYGRSLSSWSEPSRARLLLDWFRTHRI
ncbi:MAG TPA: BLUF domain-containing protein [Naasia sp.]